jgi:hypothetical protein
LHVNTYAITLLHHFALASLIHCTILLLAHICSYTLDHVEPDLKELMEQAQAEDLTDLALDQASLGTSNHILEVLLNFIS